MRIELRRIASRRSHQLVHGSMKFLLIIVFISLVKYGSHGYAPHQLNRKDIAGVWRLTNKRSFLPKFLDGKSATAVKTKYPMKEFTVYPKKEGRQPIIENDEMLLMLSEDGTFMQYGGQQQQQPSPKKFKIIPKEGSKPDTDTDAVDGDVDVDNVMKGTWDFVSGKLILAADRPKNADLRKVHDTILVGEVVAASEQSLSDNPILSSKSQAKQGAEQQKRQIAKKKDDQEHLDPSFHSDSDVDVHLSVPKGSVKIGKFVYPKHHPSFFEQPIFKPMLTGSFQLRQVLGTLNTKSSKQDQPVVEKFNKDDFVGKRFLLASNPLQPKRGGKKRWSIKYNKFVEDEPPKTKEEEEMEANRLVPIRVIELELFANNTFSTFAGLGSSNIVRGKWSIIGNEKDQLWMQVRRFGFGRSVSGSTYCEGNGITHNDEKAYWGWIYNVGEADDAEQDTKNGLTFPQDSTDSKRADDARTKAVEIRGTVLDGWGLEPCPVARFTMKEKSETYDGYFGGNSDNDDDDDDDDEIEKNSILKTLNQEFDDKNEIETDGFFSDNDAFQ